jgi:hypothetical protein
MAKRYQRGSQKSSIEERQTTQWSKEKRQQNKQWSTKHCTQKTKDCAKRTELKTGVWGFELRCSGRVSQTSK